MKLLLNNEHEDVEDVIILCAGRGRRMGELTKDVPKCLLEINGKTILGHQLDAFAGVGVKNVTLVVGYKAELVIKEAEKSGLSINSVYNQNFATSNTLASLYLARKSLEKGSWLANGDVLMSFQALSSFGRQLDMLGLVRHQCGDEEVKVMVGEDHLVSALTKNMDGSQAFGEFVGVAKFSARTGKLISESLARIMNTDSGPDQYFEAAIEPLLKQVRLGVVDVTKFGLTELDTEQDYLEACKYWPRGD